MLEFLTPNDPALFAENDALTIQNAIAAAEKDGCRKLRIPRYNLRTKKNEWRIDRAIRIPSDFTVVLDNCYMVQETGIYDRMFTNANSNKPENLTAEAEQHDITLIGEGNVILDGGVHNHLLEKTTLRYGLPSVWMNTMIYWENVRNLHVENLYIRNQRWWGITNLFCRDAVYKNIIFEAIPHVPNMDGIDLRTGCNNFLIENITGRTGDDTVAMTALNGKYEREHRVEGKDTHIHDVRVRNVISDPYTQFCVRVLNHGGNCAYNIDLDTIYDTSDYTTKRRPRCTVGVGSMRYFTGSKAEPHETRNITAKHMISRGEDCLRLDNCLSDSTFTNVKTYGDNIVAIGTFFGGTRMENVTFDSVYYGTKQQEIFCSKDLSPEEYTGKVLNMFGNSSGNITIKNLVVDKVNTVFEVSGDLDVKVEGYACGCALKTAVLDGGKVTVDGEEIANG